MVIMPSHVSRYILWATPDSAPPFPVNKNAVAPTSSSSSTSSASSGGIGAAGTPPACGAATTSIKTAVNTAAAAAQGPAASDDAPTKDGKPTFSKAPLAPSPPAPLDLTERDGMANKGVDFSSNSSSFKVGEWQAATGPAGFGSGPAAGPVVGPVAGHVTGDARAVLVHKALADPSKWLLRNRETGEEVEAAAFVEALMARRPTPQQTWCTGSPQLGPSQGSGGWMSRRQRNQGPIYRRPTLLPHCNGGGMNVGNSLSFPAAAAAAAAVGPAIKV